MRLALGTAQFGMKYGIANHTGQISNISAKDLLDLAMAHGVDVLDTAVAYGESETCLGDAGSKDFRVITKLPPLPVHCQNINAWVHDHVDASLMRLRVDHLYGLLLHNASDLLSTHGQKLYEALQSLRDLGIVHKIGVSIYSPSILLDLTSLYKLDLVQAPLNVFDQRLVSSGWLEKLKDLNVEVHVRSAFLQGLLLMSKKSIPPYFSKWDDKFSKWFQRLEQKNISALQACIDFPLSFKEVDLIVVGVDNKSQLLDILGCMNNSPSFDYSDLACDDEQLINPSLWAHL